MGRTIRLQARPRLRRRWHSATIAAACLSRAVAIHVSRLKRISKIVFGSVIALFVLLMLAVIVPSLPRYSFASVTEARAFAHMEDAEIVDELGDTNGPYRLKGSRVSGRLGSEQTFSTNERPKSSKQS